MKRIGLIGGMSFESSAVYYTRLNQMARAHNGGLTSAEILMHSVNFETIVALQKAGRWDEAGRLLGEIGAALEHAGADCMLICTNTMHKVADAVEASLGIPLINIIDETASALKQAGMAKPLLLATRYTMEDGFYHRRMAGAGVEIRTADADDRKAIHDIIFDELCAGDIRSASRDRLLAIIEREKSRGADSVILGCTEICLILAIPTTCPCRVSIQLKSIVPPLPASPSARGADQLRQSLDAGTIRGWIWLGHTARKYRSGIRSGRFVSSKPMA
jgi:aspartate racemase